MSNILTIKCEQDEINRINLLKQQLAEKICNNPEDYQIDDLYKLCELNKINTNKE